MLRHLSTCLFLILPAAGLGEEAHQETAWVPMSGDEIRVALTGRALEYKSAHQDFRASGRTRYVAGRESWGYWRVEGDQYCSMWPPSSLWACYGMAQRGETLRFIGEAGDTTDGVYSD